MGTLPRGSLHALETAKGLPKAPRATSLTFSGIPPLNSTIQRLVSIIIPLWHQRQFVGPEATEGPRPRQKVGILQPQKNRKAGNTRP